MVKGPNLYDEIKLPADENLVQALLNKYLTISLAEMQSSTAINNLLYNKINIINDKATISFNQADLNKFLAEINEDFVKAGRPYDINKHGGVSPLGVMPGWITFQSWNLCGGAKIPSESIAHRFYFAISNDKVYDLAHTLYQNFKNQNVPFYFKTDAWENIERHDKLVLYTSTPLLDETLKVLATVAKTRPDLMASLKEPSILMGKLDSKIGYASESRDGSKSYTEIIIASFLEALEISAKQFLPKYQKLYHDKLNLYLSTGRNISNTQIKLRILVAILQQDPNYLATLTQIFKQKLTQQNIDVTNICFNKRAKAELTNLNKIALPNGQVLTPDEYLAVNNVLYWCPINAKVTLANGTILSGQEFILGALARAHKFNTFQELVNFYGAKIDRTVDLTTENNSTHPKR